MKSLPARPSLESLRKQAKKLARERQLTQRDAQLTVAREYGFDGWLKLVEEVKKRVGNDIDWAATQAQRAIHDNDVDRLKQLLAEYPALLTWRGAADATGLLGFATGAYGDAGSEERERWFTRAASAEALIDAGAVVSPSVPEGILRSRAKGLLELFDRKGLLPKTLEFFAALGDISAVSALLRTDANDIAAVNEAFVCACRFEREVASLLLERLIALDPELGRRIDASIGRAGFVRYFIDHQPRHALEVGPWKAFVMSRVTDAMHDGDLATFVDGLEQDPWLLGDESVSFQTELIEIAALNDTGPRVHNGRQPLVAALLDLDPAILHRQPAPESYAIESAFTYANTQLLPLITRIWRVPDDLPYAAGLGDLVRVKQWFDESGAPRLGNLRQHYPYSNPRVQRELGREVPNVQKVLDVALAYAVINGRFEVADFLLAHGADVSTHWNSHEPASILHHLIFLPNNYASMKYLIDRGIDMTIEDYRWSSTAIGWARYALKDEHMAQWLEREERERAPT